MDARAGGILLDPTVDLLQRFGGVALLSGKQIGFRQPRQILMPVQFVNCLRVAGGAVFRKIIVAPEAPFPYPAGQRVAMPVDFRSQFQGPVAEQFDYMAAKLLRLLDSSAGPLRTALVYESSDFPRAAAVEAAGQGAGEAAFKLQEIGWTKSGPAEADPLHFRSYFLPHAECDFPGRHSTQPFELVHGAAPLKPQHILLL